MAHLSAFLLNAIICRIISRGRNIEALPRNFFTVNGCNFLDDRIFNAIFSKLLSAILYRNTNGPNTTTKRRILQTPQINKEPSLVWKNPWSILVKRPKNSRLERNCAPKYERLKTTSIGMYTKTDSQNKFLSPNLVQDNLKSVLRGNVFIGTGWCSEGDCLSTISQ